MTETDKFVISEATSLLKVMIHHQLVSPEADVIETLKVLAEGIRSLAEVRV